MKSDENSNVDHLKDRLCTVLDCQSQRFNYTKQTGKVIHGHNLIAVARAPRGDGTEAMLVSTSLRCRDGSVNQAGASFLASLALAVKRTCRVN
jgi:glycosylphosphatidylinositol transamidase